MQVLTVEKLAEELRKRRVIRENEENKYSPYYTKALDWDELTYDEQEGYRQVAADALDILKFLIYDRIKRG